MTDNPLSTDKMQRLQQALREHGRVIVAFSGGVDSTFLLRVAAITLGPEKVQAVIGDSESLPRRELTEALDLTVAFGVRCRVVHTGELMDPEYAANTPNRCYQCKKALFRAIHEIAECEGGTVILDGNNADDLGDYRPGRRAAREIGVRSPLQDAGLTKAEVRELSRGLGLPTADKPAQACLASRLPYGVAITPANLAQIEKAENCLRDLGFSQVRVRHHGEVARLELLPDEMPRLLDPALREKVDRQLKETGYRYVSLDLRGYRTGSFNPLPAPEQGT